MSSKVGILRVLWVLLAVPPLFFGKTAGAQQARKDYSAQFEQDSYVVGILELSDENLSLEHRSLLKAIPATIFSQLRGIEEHRFSEQEKRALGRKLYEQKKKLAYEDYQTLQTSKEQSFFEGTEQTNSVKDTQFTVSRVKKLARELGLDATAFSSDFVAGIGELEYQTLESLEIPESLPVQFKRFSYDGERPFLGAPFDLGSFSKYRREQEVDFLIGGSLRRFQESFLLTLFYQGLAEEEPLVLEGYIAIVDLEHSLREFLRPLIEKILGRSYARLNLRVVPSSAFIYLDGELKGIQNLEYPYAEPGMRELVFSEWGYWDYKEYVYLEAGQNLELERVLVPSHENRILSLDSQPQGANIYLEGAWVGKTPYFLGTSSNARILEFELPGFQTQLVDLAPGQFGDLQLLFKPEQHYESFQRAQTRFYILLGLFGASVTSAVFSNHYTRQFSSVLQLEDLQPQFRAQMQRSYHLALGLNIAAFTLVGAFGVGLLVDLFVNYIPAAKRRAHEKE